MNKHAAHFRQLGISAFQFQQFDSQPFLKPSDGVADRGLGAIELFRCKRKAAQLHDGLQGFPFIESSVQE